MSSSRNEFREVFRTLLLPISAEKEDDCLAAFEGELQGLGLTTDEYPVWLRLKIGLWRDSGTIDPSFKAILVKVLGVGHLEFGGAISSQYLDLHSDLMSLHFMSHDQALAFLSHSLLMARLSNEEFMSSAQIANLLSARDTRVAFSRQSVDRCVTKLGVKRDFSQQQIEELFQRDSELEEAVFADADLLVCAETIDQIAVRLGFPGNLRLPLIRLAQPENLDAFTPYLQILHYQCVLAEFFDHAVTDLYEFNPRGSTAAWLFSQYPDALVKAGNPFLNNAKSVERVSDAWARSKKKKERLGAFSLLVLLVGLESMGFAARQELASWLRLWLHRVIRYAQPLAYKLPPTLSTDDVARILGAIRQQDSKTAGVLEQRIVDALTFPRHEKGDGWRGRGLGDSVNATNISRRKLGDCDYQNTEERRVIAYEAHGGKLTQIYLDEHRRTLEKALHHRCDEWSGFSEPDEWCVDVIFIAHELAVELPDPFELAGVTVRIFANTYSDFIGNAPDIKSLQPSFDTFLVAPLNEKRTPNRVRQTLIEMIGVN